MHGKVKRRIEKVKEDNHKNKEKLNMKEVGQRELIAALKEEEFLIKLRQAIILDQQGGIRIRNERQDVINSTNKRMSHKKVVYDISSNMDPSDGYS